MTYDVQTTYRSLCTRHEGRDRTVRECIQNNSLRSRIGNKVVT